MDQVAQQMIEQRQGSGYRRDPQIMVIDEEGRRIGYDSGRGITRVSLYRDMLRLERENPGCLAEGISRRRCFANLSEFLDQLRQAMQKYFHGVDAFRLRRNSLLSEREPFEPILPQQCAERVKDIEESIFFKYEECNRTVPPDGVASFAREAFVPLLLDLLGGVVSRPEDLYSRLISEAENNDLFALRTLDSIPADWVTADQIQYKGDIHRAIEALNASVQQTTYPAKRFEDELARVWGH